MTDTPERATELEWLQYFYSEADFGPADSDVRYYIERDFINETGKQLPEGYGVYQDEDEYVEKER